MRYVHANRAITTASEGSRIVPGRGAVGCRAGDPMEKGMYIIIILPRRSCRLSGLIRPSYSPDLNPTDFHTYIPQFRYFTKRKTICSREAVENTLQVFVHFRSSLVNRKGIYEFTKPVLATLLTFLRQYTD